MEGSGSTIKGLRIVQSPLGDGVRLENPLGGNFVQGNYIGTDGSVDLGNDVNGVYVASPSNTIGGTSAGTANVISGNNNTNVYLASDGNAVAGNLIGTNAAGTAPISNGGPGIQVFGSNNCIGGVFIALVCTPSAAARNVISGNQFGIVIRDGSFGNKVLGNFIGTRVDGASALGNGLGVLITAVSPPPSPANNVVGSATDAAARNVIAFNALDGVNVASGTGNAIRGNSIHSNGQLGIDLAGGTETAAGVTQNDAGDGDGGPNALQNWPVLTLAASGAGQTNVQGTLNSTASTTFNLDFYHGASCDAAGNGEGEVFLGSKQVTTDGSGNVGFVANFPTAVAAGRVVTATATRNATPLDTSEFSNCETVAGPMVVDTTSDANLTACTPAAGDCSLRGALNNANADAAADFIDFNIPPGGAQTITITGSFWPTISQPVTINGTTQPGYTGSPIIELNGNSFNQGLVITAGGSTLRGLVINRFGLDAVRLQSDGNSVANSYIGTDVSGTADLGNSNGIVIDSGDNNCIGGTLVSSVCTHAPSDRNVISGNNQTGVFITGTSTGNVLLGNYVGTDVTGAADLGNSSNGIDILGSSGNTIGGTIGTTPGGGCTGDCNLISGNNNSGISARGNTTVILGNYIGIDVSGNVDLGNSVRGVGGSSDSAVTGTTIGNGTAAGRNVISGNNFIGVDLPRGSSWLIRGNYIGTNSAGNSDLGNGQRGVVIGSNASSNTIGGSSPGQGNLISGNDLGGISIGGDNNVVRGNLIGTAADGITPLANAGAGVRIAGPNAFNNVIGGIGVGEANTIAFSSGDGVQVDGAGAVGNNIRGNSIHSNGLKAIELVNGGNGEPGQGPPAVTSAGSAGGTSTCLGCTLDVYSDNAGQGRVYHGSTTTSPTDGSWSFPGAVVGPNVTAALTRGQGAGSTSEFSGPFACPDDDADFLCPSGDPCDGDDDCDNDGWKDGAEANFIGTDPLDGCPDNPSDNAWPADINNDGVSDITDVVLVGSNFGKAVPPAPARHDVAPDPPDGVVDITDIVRVGSLFGKACTP
jgi:hypothetical protein